MSDNYVAWYYQWIKSVQYIPEPTYAKSNNSQTSGWLYYVFINEYI